MIQISSQLVLFSFVSFIGYFEIIFTQNLLIKNVILVAAGVEKRDKISLNCCDFSVISSTARYGFCFSPIFDRNFLYFLISLKSLHFNIILFVMF